MPVSIFLFFSHFTGKCLQNIFHTCILYAETSPGIKISIFLQKMKVWVMRLLISKYIINLNFIASDDRSKGTQLAMPSLQDKQPSLWIKSL